MPLVAETEQVRFRRRPRNQPIPETDPNPSLLQSTLCKSTISSLFLSSFTSDNSAAVSTPKKKNFASGTLRGLGCAASPQVSVPAVIQASANWEAKQVRKKKKDKNKNPNSLLDMDDTDPPSVVSDPIAVPDVCCGPGIGFATEAASVECAGSRRPGRLKVHSERTNQRERPSCSSRRSVNSEPSPTLGYDHSIGASQMGFEVFGARYHRHVRPPSPDEFAEIMRLQNSLLMGRRSHGNDRYRGWRLDVDNMSYEELLELGDRIGHVNTGLKEDEIVQCVRKTKPLFSQFPTEIEYECSICQERYEAEDEMGKLECGHFYHSHCIKEWLARKNTCPVCKTEAASQR